MRSAFNPEVQHQSVDHKVVASLERLGHVFRRLLWEKVTLRSDPYGLTPTQIQILIFLRFHLTEMGRVGVLAREFDLTPATVSDAVRVLARKGLLTKRTPPGDARARVLELTGEGRKLADELADWANVLLPHLADLDKDDKIVVMRFLLNFIDSLQRAGIVTVARMCVSCRHFDRDPAPGSSETHYCRLLERPLAASDLRVDCPEHEATDVLL